MRRTCIYLKRNRKLHAATVATVATFAHRRRNKFLRIASVVLGAECHIRLLLRPRLGCQSAGDIHRAGLVALVLGEGDGWNRRASVVLRLQCGRVFLRNEHPASGLRLARLECQNVVVPA